MVGFWGVKTGLRQLGLWFVGRLWACGRDVAGLLDGAGGGGGFLYGHALARLKKTQRY